MDSVSAIYFNNTTFLKYSQKTPPSPILSQITSYCFTRSKCHAMQVDYMFTPSNEVRIFRVWQSLFIAVKGSIKIYISNEKQAKTDKGKYNLVTRIIILVYVPHLQIVLPRPMIIQSLTFVKHLQYLLTPYGFNRLKLL